MSPKEKAIELVNKFNNIIPRECDGLENITSEFCALIAVDELKKQEFNLLGLSGKYPTNYWNEVKQEIEKL
jgi:hypothetical protein